MTQASRREALSFGARAETAAALWLQAKGYRILARGFTVRNGELDIIAARGDTIAFVEVKARGSLDAAHGAIDARKQRRLRHAAKVWLTHNPWAGEKHTLRGDAVLVGGLRPPTHIENAFPLE
jgi:putative endonuclease